MNPCDHGMAAGREKQCIYSWLSGAVTWQMENRYRGLQRPCYYDNRLNKFISFFMRSLLRKAPIIGALILSALAVPVNAQLSKQDVIQTWHRGAFNWDDKKQFASYKYLGKGSEFAVAFVYPGSGIRWDLRMPSLSIIDCKAAESIGGWIVPESTQEQLLKDSSKFAKQVNQFAADFCATHKSLFPDAAIYKDIEM